MSRKNGRRFLKQFLYNEMSRIVIYTLATISQKQFWKTIKLWNTFIFKL